MDVRVVTDMEEVGRALKAARLRKGWPQAEVAAKARIGQAAVSRAERGGGVNFRDVLRVAEVFGLRLVLVEPKEGTEVPNFDPRPKAR